MALLPDLLLDELERLAEMRHRAPAAALERARALLGTAGGDPRVEARARHVIGLALHELGQPAAALQEYDAAVETAVLHDLRDCEAAARASSAVSLLAVGDPGRADREIAAARAVCPDAGKGVVELLYGLVLQRTGRLDAALVVYGRAVRLLHEADDRIAVARLRLNRGILHAYRGNLDAALVDLSAAEALSVEFDLPVLTAMAAHNVGFAHGRRGDVPGALAAFTRAEQAYHDLGDPARLVAVLEADRCELLLAAGLNAEARAAAEAALAALAPTADLAHMSEARLLLARALLAGGDRAGAAAHAQEAAGQFRRSHRLAWAALADYVAIQARSGREGDDDGPALLEYVRSIATDLAGQGWTLESLHARTFAGRLALDLGHREVARAELAAAAQACTRGTAGDRAHAWYARALLRQSEGDVRGAKRALARGMSVVEAYRATLGGTELRVHASAHGRDLARLGTRLAFEAADARAALRWAERARAAALLRPAVRPPPDEGLAATLAELRRLHVELRECALEGRPAPGLRERVASLEETVRRAMRGGRDDGMPDFATVTPAELRAALGDRFLVEYVSLDGRIHAITAGRRGLRLHELCSDDQAGSEKEYLLFALRRLVAAGAGPGPGRGAEGAARAAATRLDDLLMAPLRLPDSSDVVVVPTGVLHGTPWSALPLLAGRSVTVAPSATLWCRGEVATGGAVGIGDRITLVAGPDLPGCAREVEALARLYPDGRVLAGAEATCAAVTGAIEQSDLVHLAAHGNFRADSPLFSSLLLADGPLNVYDLEALRSVPRVVVLPACHGATAGVSTGDELLGSATALLGLGVGWVVAPVMAVPDEATIPLMVELHELLRKGIGPADALAQAGERSRVGGGALDLSVAAAFVCIGSDDGALTG